MDVWQSKYFQDNGSWSCPVANLDWKLNKTLVCGQITIRLQSGQGSLYLLGAFCCNSIITNTNGQLSAVTVTKINRIHYMYCTSVLYYIFCPFICLWGLYEFTQTVLYIFCNVSNKMPQCTNASRHILFARASICYHLVAIICTARLDRPHFCLRSLFPIYVAGKIRKAIYMIYKSVY